MILVSEHIPSPSAPDDIGSISRSEDTGCLDSSGRNCTESLDLQLALQPRLEGTHSSTGGGRGSSQRPARQSALVPQETSPVPVLLQGSIAASSFHLGREEECEPQGTSHLMASSCLSDHGRERPGLGLGETGSNAVGHIGPQASLSLVLGCSQAPALGSWPGARPCGKGSQRAEGMRWPAQGCCGRRRAAATV